MRKMVIERAFIWMPEHLKGLTTHWSLSVWLWKVSHNWKWSNEELPLQAQLSLETLLLGIFFPFPFADRPGSGAIMMPILAVPVSNAGGTYAKIVEVEASRQVYFFRRRRSGHGSWRSPSRQARVREWLVQAATCPGRPSTRASALGTKSSGNEREKPALAPAIVVPRDKRKGRRRLTGSGNFFSHEWNIMHHDFL